MLLELNYCSQQILMELIVLWKLMVEIMIN